MREQAFHSKPTSDSGHSSRHPTWRPLRPGATPACGEEQPAGLLCRVCLQALGAGSGRILHQHGRRQNLMAHWTSDNNTCTADWSD